MPTLKLTSKRNQRDFPWPGALLADRDEPTWDEIQAVLGELIGDGAPLYVTGGEPTMRRDWVALLARLAAALPGREIVLVTNGRVFFYERMCDALASLPASVSVEVCILSTRRDVHDRVVGVPESFDQASRGVEQLITRGRRVRVRVLAGSHNVDHLHDIAACIPDRFAGAQAAVWDAATLSGAADGSWRVRPHEVAGPLESAINLLRVREFPSAVIGMPTCSLSESYRRHLDRAVIGSFRDDCVRCRLRADCPGLFGALAADPEVRVYPVGAAADADTAALYERYLLDLLGHYVPPAARGARAVLDAMCGAGAPNLAGLRRFFHASQHVHGTDIDLQPGLACPPGTVAFRADLRRPLPDDRRYDFIALFKPPGETPELPVQQGMTHLLAALEAGGYVLAVLAEHTDVQAVLEALRRRGMSVLRSEPNAVRHPIEPDHKWVILCRSVGE
jgi:MoaA/NifB/PqqE/SkfB family radical SAM enzyme